MPDIGAIAGMMAALNGAFNISKAMIGLHDAGIIQEKVIELQRSILEAQNSAFAAQSERATLVERISALEAEVINLKRWDAEKQDYELKELWHGAFAYVLKPDTGRTEPTHWLCPTCFQQGTKSILQDQGRDPKDSWLVRNECPKCKTRVLVHYEFTPRKPWPGD